ncbi:hypothetical protein [Bacillus sp. IBL03825]|uniref:hypothetical protein n=1 Tax=Bacillus sp. IBL03825 TaxID=2953580 RepID=UPI00215738BF|nr:hypothetical protein [Bacillus sp. IBL03825]MCR6850469.1 hypothetical protein [Bacillus sp. IBL03825]
MGNIYRLAVFSLASTMGINIFSSWITTSVKARKTKEPSKLNEYKVINAQESLSNENSKLTLNIEVFFAGNRYNVIIFTSNSDYKYNFNGIKFNGSTIFNSPQYSIWMFEHDRFENNNNKGSWSYRGWFRTNNQYIVFYHE